MRGKINDELTDAIIDYMIGAPGGVEVERYAYQGFGEAVGFTPAAAKTVDLFAGDAEYDVGSGF